MEPRNHAEDFRSGPVIERQIGGTVLRVMPAPALSETDWEWQQQALLEALLRCLRPATGVQGESKTGCE